LPNAYGTTYHAVYDQPTGSADYGVSTSIKTAAPGCNYIQWAEFQAR
jgi:hypothetical protein